MSCPSSFFAQMINNKAVCTNCSDPSVTGNPCNRSYTFDVQTTVSPSGDSFVNKVVLAAPLSSDITK